MNAYCMCILSLEIECKYYKIQRKNRNGIKKPQWKNKWNWIIGFESNIDENSNGFGTNKGKYAQIKINVAEIFLHSIHT